MQLTVHVTEQDIANGVECNCTLCPVALALVRSAKKALGYYPYNVSAGPETLCIWPSDAEFLSAVSPHEVYLFMLDFDTATHYPAKVDMPGPFTFEIELT